MKLDIWEAVPPGQRRHALAALADAEVLRLAKQRAKQRKSTTKSILVMWVVNGYLPRPRMQQILQREERTR